MWTSQQARHPEVRKVPQVIRHDTPKNFRKMSDFSLGFGVWAVWHTVIPGNCLYTQKPEKLKLTPK